MILANQHIVCNCDFLFFYRLQDVAGYGVAVATTKVFASAFSDRIFLSPLLELLTKNGRNGIAMLLLKVNFVLNSLGKFYCR